MKAAGREREAQQEQANRAAERADQLRAELTRARIELEFFERRPVPSEEPAEADPAPGSPRGEVRRRGGPSGVAVGLWLVAFYLLLVALAHGTPDVTAAGDLLHPSVALSAPATPATDLPASVPPPSAAA